MQPLLSFSAHLLSFDTMLKRSSLIKALSQPSGGNASTPEPKAQKSDAQKSKAQELKAQELKAQKSKGQPFPLKRKLTVALALLGAGSGLAFTQAKPDAIKDVLPNREVAAPLKQPSDLPIELMAKGNRSLFLTNEIFYRKIEAIAQVSRNPVAVAGSAAQASSAESKPAKTGADKTSTGKTDTKKADLAKSETPQAAKPKPAQPEKVVAAAPPAPKAAPIAYTGTTIDNVLEMRVAVAKDVSAISLATSSSGSLTDLEGSPLKTLSSESSVTAEINGGITVDGQPMPSAFWVYPEDGGYVAVGGSWYRGRVMVALRERGLIAVNYVLLGDYLYSVVGTEVSPDWPIESMKAQAVAARSYALTHNISPASEAYFDLDNTQRFQAYKGIAREASTTQTAVQATSGEFISHDGGIVESLYAASQAIVDDAHKGSGMSQLGAKDLASQGYSYTEILAHYYPGTSLGRIETDTE